jgi:Tol biopolymer transport system component
VIGLDGFQVLPDFDPHPCGVWSPDGRWIALAGGGEVWVVDTQSRAIRRLPDLHPLDLEWRPGTDELTIAGDLESNRSDMVRSTPVTVYSVTSGETRQLGSFEAGYVTWSPDGTTLAYTGASPDTLSLVDADGGNERTLLADMGKPANHGLGPVWSPRGDRILYQRRIGCCEASEVVLVSVADGASTVIDNPSVGNRGWFPYTVTWSPDGTTLLYTAWSPVGAGELNGLIAVPADTPANATMLTDLSSVGRYHSHLWARVPMWGRQPDL